MNIINYGNLVVNGELVKSDQKITIVSSNPKRIGSSAHQRFEQYMNATTVAEYFEYAVRADLKYDVEHQFVTFID